jgi:release factor glutamine methyltransferase
VTSIGEAVAAAAARLDAAGIGDARLEADVLLAHALAVDRTRLLATARDALAPDRASMFEQLLQRRLTREPLAYIVGRREFYSLDFACEPGVLIPRPETELLAGLAIDAAHGRNPLWVIDVGTGTGALAVVIAVHVPHARVAAIDSSPAALALARRNIAAHAVDRRVIAIRSDLLAGLQPAGVIVANLPYIPAPVWPSLQPEVRDYEPREALVAGERGDEAIERLLRQAPAHLSPGGVVAVEVGAGQAKRVTAIARSCFPEGSVSVIKDLAGIDRVVATRVP